MTDAYHVVELLKYIEYIENHLKLYRVVDNEVSKEASMLFSSAYRVADNANDNNVPLSLVYRIVENDNDDSLNAKLHLKYEDLI